MSGKKASSNGNAAGVATAARPQDIRNVVLVGRPDAGKTALVDALLAESTGRAPAAAAGGPPPETHHTLTLGVYPIHHDELVINLIDTPGLGDFVGELRAGLRAGDAALFVVSATAGIDPTTVALWHECEVLGTPRAVVITRHDVPGASYPDALERCRAAFPGCVPLYLVGSDPSTLTGLLSRSVYEHRPDGSVTRRPHDPATDGEIDDARAELIEAIVENSEDETLLDRYVAGEELEFDTLMHDLELAVCRGHFFPVLPASAPTGVGLVEVLEVLSGGFPSPAERPLPPTRTPDGEAVDLDAGLDGPLVAEVVRTSVDPYLGRVTVLRLFSGTLTRDLPIHVCGRGGDARGHAEHDSDELAGALYSPLGDQLRPVERVVAGDLCALTRLTNAETADTISARAHPLLVEPWPLPDPQLPVAVETATRSDEDNLPKALARLVAADPTVRVERNATTGQLVLWCLGEAHAESALAGLRANGAGVSPVPVQVPLMSTFAEPANGHGRLVKQSGGHGQYAVCDVTVTPLPRGSGVRFEQKVTGGAVPSQYIGSVEKGARHQLDQGLDADRVPVTDVLVTLLDGKAHSVDSSDTAFQTAGSLAVKDAAAKGHTVLLEPIAAVEITVPDSLVGAVLSDLAGRRGRVTGTDPDPDNPGWSVVHAEVPDIELTTYVVSLRAATGGTGLFTRRFARYDVMPAAVAARRSGD